MSEPTSFFDAAQLLDTMAEGVVAVDREGIIRSWNVAMGDLTGYGADEALGKPISWLRAPDCMNARDIEKLLRDDASPVCISGCECRLVARGGMTLPVVVNARVLRDAAGTTIGVLQTVSDYRPILQLREQVDLLRHSRPQDDGFEGLIGRSHVMQEAFRMLELAAASDTTVLLRGESGTGKELAAAAVHHRSKRAAQPFVRVNCAALSDSLLESELFGHARGAFTGAIHERIGRFEAADGGTIFLDEIGDVTPAMQIKLLRVLQEGEFERLGETGSRHVDVRVVAATNRDLEAALVDGTFREDLYYRLRVLPIPLPSLRERRDDLAPLVDHFISKFVSRTNKPIASLTGSAMQAIRDYSWPGNVRELENAIEYAFVVCPGNKIGLEHLPQELQASPTHRPLSIIVSPSSPRAATRALVPETRRILRSSEKLQELLEHCGWSKAEAARRLGCSHTAIWKWMKHHNIPLKQPS